MGLMSETQGLLLSAGMLASLLAGIYPGRFSIIIHGSVALFPIHSYAKLDLYCEETACAYLLVSSPQGQCSIDGQYWNYIIAGELIRIVGVLRYYVGDCEYV